MNCLELSVIPQYIGTCWFNTILMIALYSQYTRKAVIKASKNWNKNDSFLMVLKTILKIYNKEPEKVQDFFYKIKPEKILLKILKKYNNKVLFDNFKFSFKNYGFNDTFGFPFYYNNYINKFFNFIGVKTLDIYFQNNKYLLNIDKYIIENKNNFTVSFNNNIINKTKKILKNIPDVLIVQHYLNDNNFNNIYNHKDNPYKSSLFDFNVSGIDNMNDTITLNGYKYRLDSIILGNYNFFEINEAHIITGLTCNDEHYVYNGWNMTDNHYDVLNMKYKKINPCYLMKFNWNVKKNIDFYLNRKLCKLEFIKNKNNLYFNFSKGYRVFIYSKINNKKIKFSDSPIKNDIILSNMSNIVENMHNIDNMSKKQLLKQFELIYQYSSDLYEKPLEELRKIYKNFLKTHYNLE